MKNKKKVITYAHPDNFCRMAIIQRSIGKGKKKGGQWKMTIEK
jgi:hypothetical protein